MASARFPTPPRRTNPPLTFPGDKKEFYAGFQISEYTSIAQFNGADSAESRKILQSPVNSIYLPIPKKINDATTLTWNEESLLSKGLSLLGSSTASAVTSAAQAVSPFLGYTVNPFLYMQFQRPNFKEFVFQWTLTANSPEDSVTIRQIINTFKKAALPTNNGLFLKYPNILDITFYPDDLFGMMYFKPCAIISVQADLTGAGSPAFFKKQPNQKGGAPVVVNLSISLKEIQLWDSTEINVG